MSTTLAATVLEDLAAVRLEVVDAPAGAVPISRADRRGISPVRQLPDQESSAGLLTVVDYEVPLDGPVRYEVEGVRTNVITNPNFETDASGWFGTRGNVGTSITGPYEGTRTGTYTSTDASVAGGNYMVSNTWSTRPGQTWTATATTSPWGSAGVSTFKLALQWMVAGVWGYYTGAPASVYAGTAPGVKAAMAVTSTAPAGATQGRVVVYCQPDAGGGMPVGSGFGIDLVMSEATDEVRPFIVGTEPLTVTATVDLGGTGRPVVSVPLRPAIRADLAGDSDLIDYDATRTSRSVRHAILGASDDVLILRPMSLRSGTVTFRLEDYETAAQVEEVLAAADVVLVRQAPFAGMDLYATVDQVRLAPIHDDLEVLPWQVSAMFTETQAPTGGLLGAAGWTVADVVALGVTVGDLPGLFPTVYDLAVGPR